eukprot:879521-Rhodomonas_salina.5
MKVTWDPRTSSSTRRSPVHAERICTLQSRDPTASSSEHAVHETEHAPAHASPTFRTCSTA